MYKEFKKEYFSMRAEILVAVRAPRLVMARLKEEHIEDCILWLRKIKESSQYTVAKQRYKEVDDDRYKRYKLAGMMDFPEIAYRKKAFKELQRLWIDTMPMIVRRANGKA